MTNDQLLYHEECYEIQGAVFDVYREMGRGFLEAVYQECLVRELAAREIPFIAQPKKFVEKIRGVRLFFGSGRYDKAFSYGEYIFWCLSLRIFQGHSNLIGALTYRHAGRDFRLSDVSGKVVHEILR